jgi:hypothetical protein
MVEFKLQGTIEDLRATLLEMKERYPEGWEAETGERLQWEEIRQLKSEVVGVDRVSLPITGAEAEVTLPMRRIVDVTPPNTGMWAVWCGSWTNPQGGAGIKAFGRSKGSMTIFLQDGLWAKTGKPYTPIGTALDDFTQVLIEEIMKPISTPKENSPEKEARVQTELPDYIEGQRLLESQPWMKIPDHRWDRLAVRKWWEGSTWAEIAQQVAGVKERRVGNRLSKLRKQYGAQIVPTYLQLKKWGIRD